MELTAEQSRQELIAAAEQLEADAIEHRKWERDRAAELAEAEADRLRRVAEGAPSGPSPDMVADLKGVVQAKLAEARELIERGVTIYESMGGMVDQVLDTGIEVLGEVAGGGPLNDDERVTLHQRITDLEAENESLEAANRGLDEALTAARDDGRAPDAEPEPFEYDINDPIATLLDAVGDDPERARTVLGAEVAAAAAGDTEPRKGLVEGLEKLIAAEVAASNQDQG